MGKHTAYKMPAQLFHADRSTDAMHNLNNLMPLQKTPMPMPNTRTSTALDELANMLGRSRQSARNYIDELKKHDLVQFISRKPIRLRPAQHLVTQTSGDEVRR